MRKRSTVLAAFALAALGACGGGSAKPVATPAPSPTWTAASRQEWIAAADALCKAASGRIAQLRKPTNPDQIATLGPPAVQINSELLGDLKRLQPAAADRGDVTALLDSIGRLFEGSRRLVFFAQQRDRRRYDVQSKNLPGLSEEASTAAREFGLKVCGRS